MSLFRLGMFLVVVIFSAVQTAQGQAWPTKPVRMIVGAAPGVPSDTLSRGLVEPLGKALGQAIVVENRIGADGIIGTEACAKAAPDGYTLCTTASNVIIWNPILRHDLPYDALRDFAPVMHAGFFDSALIAHPSLPANTVTQLIELARSKPDTVIWGHFGVNSTGYMYEEWLKRSKGAAFYAVPYKTMPQVLTAVLANESHVTVFGLPNLVSQLKSGKVKALAVTSGKRIDWLPNVPTFAEEGIKLPLRTWFGFHYQAAISRDLVLRMNGDLRRIFNDPGFKSRILDMIGMLPNDGTPEEFDAYIRTQLKEVAEIVKFLGVKAE